MIGLSKVEAIRIRAVRRAGALFDPKSKYAA